jgi:hypothetical protein
MGDITAPRIEPLSQGNDLDKYPQGKGSQRKREMPGKLSPPPSIESDETDEDLHQIDELA